MIVKYTTNDDVACSDHNVHEWYHKVKNEEEVEVATMCQLYKLRGAHREKDIEIDYIEYDTPDSTYRISVDDTGRCSHWPKGFLDECDRFLDAFMEDYR